MRETLYTAEMSGDNAPQKLILSTRALESTAGLKRIEASDLRADGQAGEVPLEQASAGEFFEHRERGMLWGDHGVGGDEIGLLERVLAAQDRVRNHVGVDHPAGAGGELVVVLGAGALEVAVLFKEVMEAHHEVVIGRALERGRSSAQADAGGEGFEGAADF